MHAWAGLTNQVVAGEGMAAQAMSQQDPWNSMHESEIQALLAQAAPLREDANRLFHAGDIREALERYTVCVSKLPEPPPWTTFEASGLVTLRKLLCAAAGNIAQCHIKLAQLAEKDARLSATDKILGRRDQALGDFAEALRMVDVALRAAGINMEQLRTQTNDSAVWCTHMSGAGYEPWQLKPLYRRSKVYARLLDTANAMQDLRDLVKLLQSCMDTCKENEERREEYAEAQKLLKTTKDDEHRSKSYSKKLLQICASKHSTTKAARSRSSRSSTDYAAIDLANMAALALLAGADPNADDGEGTPLFKAVSCGHDHRTPSYPGMASKWHPGEEVRLVEVLLAAKADPNRHTTTAGGDTCALCRVAEIGMMSHLIPVLVNAGANTEQMSGYRDGNGTIATEGAFTPLIIASQYGHASTVAALLSAGANVNAQRSGSGLTPLHGACENNHPQLLPMLLDAGAELETRKCDGSQQTALLISAGKGWVECLRLLIEAGSDMDATFVYQSTTYTALQDAADEFSRDTGPANCRWNDCIRLIFNRTVDVAMLQAWQRLAFACSTCKRLAEASVVYQALPLLPTGEGDLHDLIAEALPRSRGGDLMQPPRRAPRETARDRQTYTAVLERQREQEGQGWRSLRQPDDRLLRRLKTLPVHWH